MCSQQIAAIEALIARAKEQNQGSGEFDRALQGRINHLHGAIKLPPDTPVDALRAFTQRYIEHVPAFVSAISEITREAGFDERVTPLLTIACDYFLAPPDLVTEQGRLEALLDKAYLAHRLLEEVNDRFIGYCGIPLAPMDTTRANVIAHELIGEPFANELDQAVLYSAELLLCEYSFQGESFQRYITQHRDRGWSEELRRWPCLAADLAIDLRFDKVGVQ